MPSYSQSRSRSEGSTHGVLLGAGGLGGLGSLPASGPMFNPSLCPPCPAQVQGQALSSLKVRQAPGAPEQGLGRSQHTLRGPGCRSRRL